MKNKKYSFNLLLLKYNKYKAKLLRFRLTGRNEHRQSVLEKHIERLSVKLNDLLGSIKKVGAVAAVSTALIFAAPNSADAQAIFAGQSGSNVTTNAFGLSNIGFNGSNVTFADLDGDGDLDFLSGASDGNFYYFENEGTTTDPQFGDTLMNPFGLTNVGSYSTPTVIDLDGDGDLDVMSGSSDGSFHYFKNLGTAGSTPSFATVEVDGFVNLVDVGQNSTIDFADMDGDGDIDVIAGRFSGDFVYFPNTGGGTPADPEFGLGQTNFFGLSDIGYFSAPVIIDLDDDGDLDIMSGSFFGNFQYFENIAGAGQTPNFDSSPEIEQFGLFRVSNRNNFDFADLDGDGDLDLLNGGSAYGGFYYYENRAGAGVVPDFSPEFAVQTNPFGLTAAPGNGSNSDLIDLDGDGDLDLMSGSYYGDFYYFRNIAPTGSNTPVFDAPNLNPYNLEPIAGSFGYGFSNADLVDLDGDGDLDLMSGSYDGDFYYFRNLGTAGSNPSFADSLMNPFGLSNTGAGLLSNSNLVDLNSDGDLDLLSGAGDGNFHYYENEGTATNPQFSSPVVNPFNLSSISNLANYSNADLVDFDGDGDFDLFSGSVGGDFFYLENTAGPGQTPNFASPETNPFNLSIVSDDLTNSNVVDLDGDGDLDLMSGSFFPGNFYYFENITCSFDPLMVALDTQSDAQCNGSESGAFVISASGATAPYEYSLNGGTSSLSGSFFDLAADTYNPIVIDANGCEATLPNSVIIQQPDSITFSSFNFTPASAPNASDGAITVDATGGTGQLTVTWTPGAQIGSTASGLTTGNYTVTVIDENNCEKTTSVFLDFEPETPNAINSLEVEDLAIYPNPTTGLVTVSFETTEQMDVEFNVVNTIGKTILTETSTAINGRFTTTFNLSNFETGVYFLQLNNGKGLVTKKITISK